MKEDLRFNVYGPGGGALNYDPMTWDEIEKCPLSHGDTILVLSVIEPPSNKGKRIKPPKVFDE